MPGKKPLAPLAGFSVLITLGALCTLTPSQARADAASRTITLNADQGQRTDTTLAHDAAGFSGTGYVTGFEAQDAALRFTFVAAAGIYEVRIRYRAPSEKGFDLEVNGKKSSGMFAASPATFAIENAGKIELQQGQNQLAIERGWGYFDIDSVQLIPASAAATPLRPIRPRLSDPQATARARVLYRSLLARYGSATLSGQHNIGDADYVLQTTGVSPAIVSGDLIEYSPTRVAHGSKPEGTTEALIAQYRKGNVLSIMWHWNAPTDLIDKKVLNAQGQDEQDYWWAGFYTRATTFDVGAALADPTSERYQLLVSNIDAIAVQLKKFQDAGIPILWRPLHEAEGGWFWWGAKGPEPFKKLWRLMYDRMVHYHHLHNMIWVYTSGGKMDWYPGDDVVDIVGTDAYPSDMSDPLSSTWDTLLTEFDGRKPLALAEFGGVPDVDRMDRFGVRWLYFDSWTGNLGAREVPAPELNRLYHEKRVLNQPDVAGLMAEIDRTRP
jgi:mannan endo-1,4-beta-mannosidase